MARKIDESDMNAQDRTLQNVTGFPISVCTDFLRSTITSTAEKQILWGKGPVGTGREESQSDEIYAYQGQCPKAVCHGAENR